MAMNIGRFLLRLVPRFLSDRVGFKIARLRSRRLIEQLSGVLTDKFLELLLSGMDLAFCLHRGYRENIKNFKARYLFRTPDNRVAAAAIFKDDDMRVLREAIDDWDVVVTFKDAAAFRNFIFSKKSKSRTFSD